MKQSLLFTFSIKWQKETRIINAEEKTFNQETPAGHHKSFPAELLITVRNTPSNDKDDRVSPTRTSSPSKPGRKQAAAGTEPKAGSSTFIQINKSIFKFIFNL